MVIKNENWSTFWLLRFIKNFNIYMKLRSKGFKYIHSLPQISVLLLGTNNWNISLPAIFKFQSCKNMHCTFNLYLSFFISCQPVHSWYFDDIWLLIRLHWTRWFLNCGGSGPLKIILGEEESSALAAWEELGPHLSMGSPHLQISKSNI